MKLWTDMVGCKMLHLGYQSAVFVAKTKKLSHLRTPIKLWNFMAILKFRLEDEDRTAPYLGAQKISGITLCLGENFNRSISTKTLVGHMIVQSCCMINCKGP